MTTTAEDLEAMTPQEHLRKVAGLEASAQREGGYDNQRSRRAEAEIHIGMALIKLGLAAQSTHENHNLT